MPRLGQNPRRKIIDSSLVYMIDLGKVQTQPHPQVQQHIFPQLPFFCVNRHHIAYERCTSHRCTVYITKNKCIDIIYFVVIIPAANKLSEVF